jgi:hypothetical protein
MLNLLESVEKDGAGSQRDRASEFGVALGLVNAYLNYCIRKGLVRVKKIPAGRYVYYLTPKGFVEKSRLAVTLVSNSFHSFRQARAQYSEAFRGFRECGVKNVVLIGLSELAEVAMLSAADTEITVSGILDSDTMIERYLGLPVISSWADLGSDFDGAVITDLNDPSASHAMAAALFPTDRVAVPQILGVTEAILPTARTNITAPNGSTDQKVSTSPNGAA